LASPSTSLHQDAAQVDGPAERRGPGQRCPPPHDGRSRRLGLQLDAGWSIIIIMIIICSARRFSAIISCGAGLGLGPPRRGVAPLVAGLMAADGPGSRPGAAGSDDDAAWCWCR
jgi:hypothetical protein